MADHGNHQSGQDAALTASAQLLRLSAPRIRLEILCVLASGPSDVSGIADALELDIAHISHHLAPLRRAGLVRASRRGKRHIYQLGPRAEVAAEGDRFVLRLEGESGSGVRIEVPGPIDGCPRTLDT